MSDNGSPRTGIEIILIFLVACLVMMAGMLTGDRRTFLLCAAISGVAIGVVIIGHLIALVMDWLRQWHTLRREEQRQAEWRINHGFKITGRRNP